MKTKFIKPILVATTISTPLITLASCSNVDLTKLSNSIKEDTIKIFMEEICPIYRSTFETRQIADYIKNWAKSKGLEPYEDNYRASEISLDSSSGNVWFDIPASKGCNNWTGLTLQAHMDMVCEEKEGIFYDWSKGVVPVIDGNFIHTKDNLTSLGGDDGIGLATILSIVKHKDEFKHGPIRCLFTADEENGDSGASMLTAEAIKYNNIINVDHEQFGDIVKSCAGTDCLKFNFPITTIGNTFTNRYTLKISNLLGDHSAGFINENRANAIVLSAECLNKLNIDIEINNFVSKSKNNNIASSCEVSFFCENEIGDDKIKSIKEFAKAKYPVETEMDINLTLTPINDESTNVISTQDSNKLISMILNLHFGPYNWFDTEHKQVSSSSNIGPFELSISSEAISFETLIRSAVASENDAIVNKNKKAVEEQFGEQSSRCSHTITPSWEYEENNPLCDLMHKAFAQDNISSTVSNCHGWLECAFFKEKLPSSHIISVGPDMSNAHGPSGYVNINSIAPLAKVLLYCCMNINNIK